MHQYCCCGPGGTQTADIFLYGLAAIAKSLGPWSIWALTQHPFPCLCHTMLPQGGAGGAAPVAEAMLPVLAAQVSMSCTNNPCQVA